MQGLFIDVFIIAEQGKKVVFTHPLSPALAGPLSPINGRE